MNPIILKAGKAGVAFVGSLLSLLPLKNTILFESSPDFACNAYPVYLRLRKELPDFKMVWYVSEKKDVPEGVDDTVIYDSFHPLRRLKELYYLYTARAVISCNREIRKPRKEQLHLFLCHGSKTKKTRGVYEVDGGVDHINVQSHFFDDIITYEYNCGKEKLVYLGYPRCDWFYGPTEGVKEALGLEPERGFLVWLPTFRKHKSNRPDYQMDTEKFASMGMPLISTPEQLAQLDAFLKEHNKHLIYKPHPAQDVSGLKAARADRVKILYDRDLSDAGLQLNQVLAASEGLITDYSSVFFDYLLSDKPIITTVDDIDEWKKMTGFAFDLDAFLDRATTRVGSLEELMAAMNAPDDKQEGRKEIRQITNTHFDGDSARRVADFVKEKIGL